MHLIQCNSKMGPIHTLWNVLRVCGKFFHSQLTEILDDTHQWKTKHPETGDGRSFINTLVPYVDGCSFNGDDMTDGCVCCIWHMSSVVVVEEGHSLGITVFIDMNFELYIGVSISRFV